MLPAIVILRPEIDLDKRPPFRPLGFADKMHPRLRWRPVCLARITRNAGANNIFPGRWSATIARHHMVEIQIFAIEKLPAILAGILVPLEDIMPGELHFFLRHSVEQHQDDHPGHTNLERHCGDTFRMRLFLGDIVPFLEVIGLERPIFSVQNYLCMALKKQSKSAPGGTDVHRLPQPVENQNLLVQKGIHTTAGLSCGGT